MRWSNREKHETFRDRRDAGLSLAHDLRHYSEKDAMVLAIPRGGVEVGFEVARHLDADFSIVITRKLPLPHNPEAGFGAMAEDGSTFLCEDIVRSLPPEQVERIIEQQKREIDRRIQVLRGGRSLPGIAGKTIILVDEGIAMGSTMRASIQLCKKARADKIVVAAPVAGPQTVQAIGAMVDEIVVLVKPAGFRAVAQAYDVWYDVSDAEVLEIMDKWRRENSERVLETKEQTSAHT